MLTRVAIAGPQADGDARPMPAAKPVHSIIHTHWDRAWYWPAERFRIKLVDCVQATLDQLDADPAYRFSSDGQVLMLEDYLQARPQDRARLANAAASGRLAVGPLWCQPDVYCTGGEALLRNLREGARWCAAHGATPSPVLHLADTFGLIPELPMLAAGFGLGGISFMRGMAGQVPGLVTMESIQGIDPQVPQDTRWFRWAGPDGSSLPTIRLRHGYASTAASRWFVRATGTYDFERYVGHLRAAAREWDSPGHPVVLTMSGVDHMIPWERQQEAHAAASDGDYRFIASTFAAVLAALQEAGEEGWPRFAGEFHGSGAASVLGGTITSRVHLKSRNAAIEQLLVHQAEPTLALNRLLGDRDPACDALGHAWRSLLLTHPHDDICGCSVDAVHHRNESDHEQAWHAADALRRRAMQRLSARLGGPGPDKRRPAILMLNHYGVARRAPVRLAFDYEGQIEWGDIRRPASFRIVDGDGAEIPFRETSHGQSDEHPRLVSHLELHPQLPPGQPVRCFIEAIDTPMFREAVDGESLGADNGRLQVVVHRDGTFDLRDLRSGRQARRLGALVSQSDIGDTYDFSDIPGEVPRSSAGGVCRLRRRSWVGGLIELIAEGSLRLPMAVDSATRTPSADLIDLPFTLTLVLAPGSDRLEVTLRLTNTAADHRLRWHLPLPEAASDSLAGIKFQTVRRPVGSAPVGAVAPRIFPEHPCDLFAAAGGLAVFSAFPRNYEVVAGADGQELALSVLRSVSWLTNPHQGATRPGVNAGPHTATPEARCLGRTYEQHLALRLAAPEDEATLVHEAACWRAQPFAGQVDATMHCPPVAPAQLPALPFWEVEAPAGVSACLPDEDGDGVILRLHNGSAAPIRTRVRCPLVSRAEPVRLDGLPDGTWSATRSNDGWELEIPPFGLRSLLLRS